jgi:hypothetical protein
MAIDRAGRGRSGRDGGRGRPAGQLLGCGSRCGLGPAACRASVRRGCRPAPNRPTWRAANPAQRWCRSRPIHLPRSGCRWRAGFPGGRTGRRVNLVGLGAEDGGQHDRHHDGQHEHRQAVHPAGPAGHPPRHIATEQVGEQERERDRDPDADPDRPPVQRAQVGVGADRPGDGRDEGEQDREGAERGDRAGQDGQQRQLPDPRLAGQLARSLLVSPVMVSAMTLPLGSATRQ